MNSTLSYQERIRQERQGFAKGFRRLADFLLDFYFEASFMTANELAHALDIDPATVVRFAQHLGYAGYPELQQELREQVRAQYLPISQGVNSTSPFEQTIRALELTRANLDFGLIDDLAERLSTARNILVASDPAGEWLAGRLTVQLIASGFAASSPIKDEISLAAYLAAAKANDLLLAIDMLGESPHLVQALKLARQSGLTVALIAGAASLPATSFADIPLIVYGANEASSRLACAATLVHTLKLAIQKRFPERMDAAQERLEDLFTLLGTSS